MTNDQLESIRTARLQLLDLGDSKTAALLDWAVTAEPSSEADDAELLRWLRPRFLAVDWDWNGNGAAIVFQFPAAATVSADLDATLRSAMTLKA